MTKIKKFTFKKAALLIAALTSSALIPISAHALSEPQNIIAIESLKTKFIENQTEHNADEKEKNENLGRRGEIRERRAALFDQRDKTKDPALLEKINSELASSKKEHDDLIKAMEKFKPTINKENNTQEPPRKLSKKMLALVEKQKDAVQKLLPNTASTGKPNASQKKPAKSSPLEIPKNFTFAARLNADWKSPYELLLESKQATQVSSQPDRQSQPAPFKHHATANTINNTYVEIGEHKKLISTSNRPAEKQESLVLTNQLGNTHGVLITEDQVIISGGAHSSNLVVDDDGVTFMSSQTGEAVVVSGVADGTAPHDAANVGQVQNVVDAAVAPLHGRIDGVENSVQRLDQKINAVEKKLSGGVAMALALSQPVSFAPQAKSAVTGGIATYNGQTAMGFSFNRLLTNTAARRTMVSAGVATTTSSRSSASARIGASFSW